MSKAIEEQFRKLAEQTLVAINVLDDYDQIALLLRCGAAVMCRTSGMPLSIALELEGGMAQEAQKAMVAYVRQHPILEAK